MTDEASKSRDRAARMAKLRWKLEALRRYPFSSEKRKVWRRRHPLFSAALEHAAATRPPKADLDARLFQSWMKNALAEYPENEFVGVAHSPVDATECDVKLIAYYLPQFHPIPENDVWWGDGFTEWRNVTRGFPNFEGHYQPRLPGELGYYDLRVPQVMKRQVELAKLYGIHAFCFHFYWFAGKTLLEDPIKRYLEDRDLDLPFCLCWANENWSRRWDGSEASILIAQEHSSEDDAAFLAYLGKYFADDRYLKVEGRPVLTIYRPSLFPDAARTVAAWRKQIRAMGYPDLYLIATNSFAFSDYEGLGFDALSEFPPHGLAAPSHQAEYEVTSQRDGWRISHYKDIVEQQKARSIESCKRIHPGIMAAWDNSARRPKSGDIYHGATPALFKSWLDVCYARASQNPPDERFVFVNAWNEWAEGTYLEPDRRFGYAYLDACAQSTLRRIRLKNQRGRITAILPCYNHEEYLSERISSVVRQTMPPAEIIFLDDGSGDGSVALASDLLAKSGIPYRIITNDVNSGSVFAQWVKGIQSASYDMIWIAETDDSAAPDFLEKLMPSFDDEDVLAAYGRIKCFDGSGNARGDLENYYDGLSRVSWGRDQTFSANELFGSDFAICNVVPNASGIVFRRPNLSDAEIERLLKYRFAGDWYFYSIILRGGRLAYRESAVSFFRIRGDSASRASFFTDSHLEEHRMVLADLAAEYGVSGDTVRAHAARLAPFFPQKSVEALAAELRPAESRSKLRICVAAQSFSVGGGEIAPIVLANELHRRGHHVTYLVRERFEGPRAAVRGRLASQIPVVYWDDIAPNPKEFFRSFDFDIVNSHNVGVDFALFRSGVDLRRKLVCSLHGGYESVLHLVGGEFVEYLKRNVVAWVYLTERNADVLRQRGLSSSAFTQAFNSLSDEDVEWVDRKSFRSSHGLADNDFACVLCSRAIEEKGWGTAIEVCRRLNASQGRKVHLFLIGDGPVYQERSTRFGHLPNVHFLGHVEEPIRLFRAFDAGVFPTIFSGESFPMFILECFRAGLPVVSTDVGDIRRMLTTDGGFAGAVIPGDLRGGDQADAFVRRLTALRDDPFEYERARSCARLADRRYTAKNLGDLYENLFLAGAPQVVRRRQA